jgi:hypothetical protein
VYLFLKYQVVLTRRFFPPVRPEDTPSIIFDTIDALISIKKDTLFSLRCYLSGKTSSKYFLMAGMIVELMVIFT